MFYLPQILNMKDVFKLSFKNMKKIGPDIRIILQPKNKN